MWSEGARHYGLPSMNSILRIRSILDHEADVTEAVGIRCDAEAETDAICSKVIILSAYGA